MQRLLALMLMVIGIAIGGLGATTAAAQTPPVQPGNEAIILTVRGAITPLVAQYVDRGIAEAERSGARCVVIQLDTPGGLDSAMRTIIQRILISPVPVIVYVSPAGGRAASAGTFIAYAAHISAMAPNTTIGSASPISVGQDGQAQQMPETLQNKVTNDAVSYIRGLAERRGRNADWAERAVREAANLTAVAAVEQRVVDLLAPDLPQLLSQLHGRTVELERGRTTLDTVGLVPRAVDPTIGEAFLQMVSDPTIAYILLSLGMLGLYFEFQNPGAILPGVAGAISLVIALFALGTLPVNWAGVLLMALAFGLFAIDLFAPSHGILTVGGLISFLMGSLLLINTNIEPAMQIAPSAILAVMLGLSAFLVFMLYAFWGDHRRRPITGREGLIGAVAITRTPLAPDGTVFIEGERWHATSQSGPIAAGQRVRVLAVEGLALTVERLDESPTATLAQA